MISKEKLKMVCRAHNPPTEKRYKILANKEKISLSVRDNPELIISILGFNKGAQFEGFIIEKEAAKSLLQNALEKGWEVINTLVVCQIWREKNVWFFRDRDDSALSIELIQKLKNQTENITRRLSLKEDKLFILDDANGNQLEIPKEITVVLPVFKKEPYSPYKLKIYSAFWGYAFQLQNKPDLFEFVKDLLIKDYYIPKIYGSEFLWDHDLFLKTPEGKIVYIEIKHKYPSENNLCRFSLNTGEAKRIGLLQKVGIECFHIILVKPLWEDVSPSINLFTHRIQRQRALWIGTKITKALFTGVFAKNTEDSSFRGGKAPESEYLFTEQFKLIGRNVENTQVLSKNFLDLLNGNVDLLTPITTKILKQHRTYRSDW